MSQNENSEPAESGHLAVCSSVLVPCPNKCGVYTPRAELLQHVQKCPNTLRNVNQSQDSTFPLNNTALSIDSSPNSALNTTPPKNIASDLKSLQNRCSVLEQYFCRLSEFHKNKTFVESGEIDRLTLHNRLLEEWRDIMNIKLDQIRQKLNEHESLKSETMKHWSDLCQHLEDFEKLKIDVSHIKEDICTEKTKTKLKDAEFSQEIITLVQVIDKQHSYVLQSFKNNDNELTLTNTRLLQLESELDQLKAKFVGLNFELRALTRMASENEEKLEIIERKFERIEGTLRQLRVDLEIAEETPDNTHLPIGRYLWKIVNVHARMTNAKNNGTVLKSPIILSHQFGYKIRIHLFLNGLNKWRDRYTLMCLQVIKGEYDLALKWPCTIEGTVTLRDTLNFERPNHISKFITVKRNHPDEETEDPQESSTTFIFIPHRTMMKPLYVRGDTLFLDINICSNGMTQQTDL